VVALRTADLRSVQADDTTVALRLLVDRRDQLGRARAELVSRLHHLLLELIAGGAKKELSAQQARALLATVRPRDVVGKTLKGASSRIPAVSGVEEINRCGIGAWSTPPWCRRAAEP